MSDLDPFASVRMFGVKVVRCPDLGQDSVYFHRFELLVVDADLSAEDAEDVACQVLGMVVDKLAADKAGDARIVEAARAEWLRRRRPLTARCDACGTERNVSASRVRQTGRCADPQALPLRDLQAHHHARHRRIGAARLSKPAALGAGLVVARMAPE